MTKNSEENSKFLERLLLDSSLITRVRFEENDYKIVKCGDYLQVYFYENKLIKNNVVSLDIDSLKNTKNIVFEDAEKKENFNEIKEKEKEENNIEYRNAIRSKLSCQRLAKANSQSWSSFITLTYADNMQDMKKAKQDLYYFTKNIQKIKKDFKYIAIPEFQKRGAIHFHLLTNISLEDKNILKVQKDNNKFYDVKYWTKGFTSYENVNGDIKKIVGYISKYMTKEIDNRLFNIKRFTSSQNLIKPQEEYINSQDSKQLEYLLNLLENKECIYENTYQDKFENNIIFKEYKIF